MTYLEAAFSCSTGDGDGPKQVPTLLKAMASALSWGPTIRPLARSNYITLFPAPLPSLLLPLFQCVISTAAGRVPVFVCAQRTQTDSGGSCETTPDSLNLTALAFFLSTACIAVTGVALFMHGLSLCFSTWVLLARGVRRKPLPPCFAQAAGELSGSCGQVFALNEAGRGTSFIRAAPAVISHCNLCF